MVECKSADFGGIPAHHRRSVDVVRVLGQQGRGLNWLEQFPRAADAADAEDPEDRKTEFESSST
jgi:hypothetical protein